MQKIKNIILTAMREEAMIIVEKYNLKLQKTIWVMEIYSNEEIVLILAGIGKIQASMATTYAVLNYDFDKFINIWIAWSLLGNTANIWDVFILSKISQHDMYLPFDWEHLYYAKKDIELYTFEYDFEVKYWHSLTGDQFIDDEQIVKNLKNKYDADVIEMEAFAVASVLREFSCLQKWVFIKAISDGADNESKEAHMDNLVFAMHNSIVVLDKVLYA